jgi:hypothetical protein
MGVASFLVWPPLRPASRRSTVHDGSGLPACSRSMYSAYQSDQSVTRDYSGLTCKAWLDVTGRRLAA